MEYLGYVVVAVIAAWVGWHARGIIFLANISERPEHMIKMLEKIKEINEQEELGNLEVDGGTEITPEQVSGYWYAYAKENGQFLGQGATLEDAIKMATDRFPNKKFWYKNPEQFSQTA